MEAHEVRFRLDLPLMSKARPRFGQGRSYLPAPYRAWKDRARRLLRFFWETSQLPTLTQCEVHVVAHGPGRCDADNLIGALLDSMIPDKRSGFAGCIKDDRVTVVNHISFRWIRSKDQFWDIRIVYPEHAG